MKRAAPSASAKAKTEAKAESKAKKMALEDRATAGWACSFRNLVRYKASPDCKKAFLDFAHAMMLGGQLASYFTI